MTFQIQTVKCTNAKCNYEYFPRKQLTIDSRCAKCKHWLACGSAHEKNGKCPKGIHGAKP